MWTRASINTTANCCCVFDSGSTFVVSSNVSRVLVKFNTSPRNFAIIVFASFKIDRAASWAVSYFAASACSMRNRTSSARSATTKKPRNSRKTDRICGDDVRFNAKNKNAFKIKSKNAKDRIRDLVDGCFPACEYEEMRMPDGTPITIEGIASTRRMEKNVTLEYVYEIKKKFYTNFSPKAHKQLYPDILEPGCTLQQARFFTKDVAENAGLTVRQVALFLIHASITHLSRLSVCEPVTCKFCGADATQEHKYDVFVCNRWWTSLFVHMLKVHLFVPFDDLDDLRLLVHAHKSEIIVHPHD